MSQNICNICGANYEYHNGRWKCPACGAFKAEELSNEEVTLLYNAAQKLRLSDFDEAEKAYADIIEKFPKNPDGYWGRLLSRYGIKYEEDFDGRKIPTCYATSIESVITDKDYLKAIELADQETKAYYTLQAEYIERVRKEWVEKARKEKPYDIFICYKDSDLANGIDRTQDSIAAQELYIHLRDQGYRVFFSRESLRGKVGEKYEPYIFNALSTAKVMLVYGSKSEYITSTWLKNEWTRYEKRLQAGEKKPNSLIVACDGFSPTELPKVLSSMQCFDATSRSFYTDLDAVLKKIIKGEEKPKPVVEPKPEKKKSKKLPIAIASIAALIAIFLCILLPNVLGDKPYATVTDSKYGVVISADSEIFDKNTSVIVDKLTDGAQYTSLVSVVNTSKTIDIQNAIIYDIECDVDITKSVTIKVAYTKSDADSTVKVYYVSDDKTTIEEHSCIYDDGYVQFKTTHLSYYVIGEVAKTTTPGGNENPGGDDPKPPVTPSLTYEDGVLQVGVSANYEPYEYLDNGQFKGIEIDILKAIATELGLEIRFENDTFEDLLGNLNAKEVDCIIGVTETAQRNELATATNALFSEDDMEFIIYLNKDCNDLRTAINTAITKLKNNGTIDGIIERYKNPGSVATHTATFKIDGQVVDTRTFYEGDTQLDLPSIPARQCYRGEWESYTLGTTDITINGHYYAAHENLVHRPASDQNDCSLVDNIEHWYCSTCDKYYLDADASSETSDVYIPAGCNFVDGACTRCQGTEGIIYSNNEDGTYSVNSLDDNCTAKHIVIPAKWDGKPVTTIDSYAFSGTDIESITFKGTITEIGNGAFQWCNSLESISLSGCSLTIINEQTFYECEKLETVELPNSIVTIGKSAFNGSSKIKYINIPSSVQTIEYGAFMNCTGMLTVSIPNNVQTIGDCAFCGCKALTTVSIGNKVETIGECAFSDCDKLTTIAFGSKVTTIEDSAFARCVELKSVQLPNSLTTLGKQVFSACGNLESINIPSSVTSVGELCFWNCSKATITCDFESKPSGWNSKWNETGGNVVWSLAKVQFLFHYEYAEGNNTQTVASVTVGELYTLPVPTRTGYTFVGWFSEAGGKGTKYTDASGKAINAFSNNTVPICNAYAYWEGSSCLTYSGGTTNYVVYEYDSSTAGRTIYIPEYYNGLPVTGINSQAFKNYSGTVVLPKSLKTIASGAFTEHHMDYIVIPEGVTTINISAFSYTDNPAGSHKFAIYYEGSEVPAGWAEGWNKYIWVTGDGFTYSHTGYITVYVAGEWHYENGTPIPDNESTRVALCFDGNGGNGGLEAIYLDPGQSIALPQNPFTYEGYTFKGWSTTPTGSVEYSSNASFTIANVPTVLYAVWEANQNRIVFQANGGSGTMTNLTLRTGESTQLPYCAFSRMGYTFAGWSTTATGSATYCNQDGYTMGTNPSYTLYAVWTPNNNTAYTVNHWVEDTEGNFNVEDSEVLYGTTDSKVSPFTKNYTGCNAPVVKEITILADGSGNVDYYYTRQTYTISYVTNGGNSISSTAYRYGYSLSLPTPCRDGYSFGGWFTEGELNNQVPFVIVTEDTTLYAWWSEESKPSCFIYDGNTAGSDGLTIRGYNGNQTSVVIPTYIGGLPVIAIADQAFYRNSSENNNTTPLESVVIPDTVLTIGVNAFSYCTNLTHVKLPSQITKLNNSVFNHCTALLSIELPSSVTYVDAYAFYNCTSLKNVILSDNITYLSGAAFQRCSALESITIPSKLEVIQEGSFEGCTSLSSIVIPNTVKTIKRRAFYDCTGLKTVVVESGVSEIEESAFYGCTSIEKMTLPFVGESLNPTWGYEAPFGHIFGRTISSTISDIYGVLQFYEGGNYYYYKIPSSIKEVIITDQTVLPEGAFAGCDFIEKITIPLDTTQIGNSAFKNCTALKQLNSSTDGIFNIPANTTIIGDSAFEKCSSVTDVLLDSNLKLTSIGASAFSECINLERFNNQSGGNFFVIPSTISVLNEKVFYGCVKLENLVFDEEVVTTIGVSAFSGCSNLTTINDNYRTFYVPDALTTIGRGAFRNVSNLDEIYIPQTVTSIGYLAFDGCSATIKCRAEQHPEGWHGDWQGEGNTVIWFYIGDTWDGTTSYSFAGGSGAEEDPYLISTAEQLAYVATAVNQGVDTFKGKYLVLTTNLHLMNKEWKPIGTETYAFEGFFDGGGYTIYGLKVSDESLDYGGLFGKIQDSTIANLTVKEANVKINQSYGRAGIILGYGYSTTQSVRIVNCSAEGNVTLSQCGSVGGIAGYVYGEISRSHFNGVVSGSAYNSGASIGVHSTVNVGGIAGTATTISNCYAEGTINGSGSSLYYHTSYTGGIAGCADSVTNCYSSANVTSSGQEYSYAGGIVAKTMYAEAIIQNCFSTGTITGTSYSSSDAFCGRIVAKCNDNDSITNCYADSLQSITKNSTTFGTLQFTQTLQSENFIYNTLGWSSDIWQINEGGFPTLK